MESSHIFGVDEECNSCESGWTMYIGSPIHTDDDDGGGGSVGDDDDDHGDVKHENDHDHDDSDDSMASDASSGPNHRGSSWGNGKGENGNAMPQNKHQVEKKGKKNQVEKNGNNARRKEEAVLSTKGANVSTQSGEKVRKNSWLGK